MTGRRRPPPWLARLLWFAALWLAGIAAVGAVAYGLRLLMGM